MKYSDERLKENVVPLATIGDVKLYRYNLRGDPTERIGVLAQELRRTHPEAVVIGGEDPKVQPWMVRYDLLAPHLAAHLG